MRHLLTPSLHDSWNWYQRMESKEKQDFLDTLLKVKTDDPEALARMQGGITFEDECKGTALGTFNPGREFIDADPAYAQCIIDTAEYIRGGLFKEKCMFDIKVAGMDFLVYGRLDVLRRE